MDDGFLAWPNDRIQNAFSNINAVIALRQLKNLIRHLTAAKFQSNPSPPELGPFKCEDKRCKIWCTVKYVDIMFNNVPRSKLKRKTGIYNAILLVTVETYFTIWYVISAKSTQNHTPANQ